MSAHTPRTGDIDTVFIDTVNSHLSKCFFSEWIKNFPTTFYKSLLDILPSFEALYKHKMSVCKTVRPPPFHIDTRSGTVH